MKRIAVVTALAALVAACGGDSAGPNPVPSLSGTWTFSDNISSAAAGISCFSTGTVTVSQSGTSFTGTVNATQGTCSDSFGNVIDNTGTNQVSGGQISGTSVSMQIPFCQLSGSFSGSPPNAMSGTETCTIAISGTNYSFTGTWQASR